MSKSFKPLPSSMSTLALASLTAFTALGLTHPARAATTETCDPYEQYECLDSYLGTGFWERLANYYKLEMGKAVPPADPNAGPSRRDDFPPAAQTMPPMPFTEWPYGGTDPMGATLPNNVDSPLMATLDNTRLGKWMDENHMEVYGWIDIGANLSTSNVNGGNAPAAYDYQPNTLDLDQAVIYVDRFPDMVQKDHMDWGYRLSMIYGSDYRYTTSYGLLSQQLLKYNKTNGFDFPMLYAQWYFPQVAQGLLVRVGRYISLPDIEAQLAPNNYMYSHSMTYVYDNYTNTGIINSVALNRNWIIQGGLTVGTEATVNHLTQTANNPFPNPWYPNSTFKLDPGSMPTVTACGRWNSDEGGDDVNFCANSINKGTYGYNNLQWYGVTYYHQFNDKWHIATELYNEHQNKVPNYNYSYTQGGVQYNYTDVIAAGGSPFGQKLMPYNAPSAAFCSNHNVLTCRSSSTGLTGYLNYSWDPLNNLSLRPELYLDLQGQRTGTPARYTNLALGWQHWFSPQIELRPEIAYYHASAPAFNGNSNLGISPDHKIQTVVSGDLIWHY